MGGPEVIGGSAHQWRGCEPVDVCWWPWRPWRVGSVTRVGAWPRSVNEMLRVVTYVNRALLCRPLAIASTSATYAVLWL